MYNANYNYDQNKVTLESQSNTSSNSHDSSHFNARVFKKGFSTRLLVVILALVIIVATTIGLALGFALNKKKQSSNDKSCLNPRWNYGPIYGPSYWPKCEPNCGGNSQSPINIKITDSIFNSQLKGFEFINFDKRILFIVKNNGDTVRFDQDPSNINKLQLKGSDLKVTFDINNFHFHWGVNNLEGSEHQINSSIFPLEMHIVTTNGKSYAVLGFLFKLSDDDNPNIQTIIDAVNRVPNENDTTQAVIILSNILPSQFSLRSYYRYSGSLTVPPCTEDIIWTIFSTTIYISNKQLNAFRNNLIKKNFRPLQNLNKRVVQKSFNSLSESLKNPTNTINY